MSLRCRQRFSTVRQWDQVKILIFLLTVTFSSGGASLCREYKARKLKIAYHALRQIVAAQDKQTFFKDATDLREWLLVLEEHL